MFHALNKKLSKSNFILNIYFGVTRWKSIRTSSVKINTTKWICKQYECHNTISLFSGPTILVVDLLLSQGSRSSLLQSFVNKNVQQPAKLQLSTSLIIYSSYWNLNWQMLVKFGNFSYFNNFNYFTSCLPENRTSMRCTNTSSLVIYSSYWNCNSQILVKFENFSYFNSFNYFASCLPENRTSMRCTGTTSLIIYSSYWNCNWQMLVKFDDFSYFNNFNYFKQNFNELHEHYLSHHLFKLLEL